MTSEAVINKTKLLEIIEDFLGPYRQEEANGTGPVAVPTEAAEYIANGSGRTPDVAARTLHRIIKENPKYVRFGTVDWLVAAGMGRPDLLHTDLVTTKKASQSMSAQLPKRQKRPPVPEGVPAKKCLGVFCRGQVRPLSEFNLNKRGKKAGRPRSYCKECEALRCYRYRHDSRRRDPKGYEQTCRERRTRERKAQDWQYDGLIPCSKVEFAVEELCRLLGPRETASRLRVGYTTLWQWRNKRVRKMYKEYAGRVLQLLWEVKNGDNGFHKT